MITHYCSVLFCKAHLLWRRVRRPDAESETELFKSDWHIVRNSECPSQVQISFYGDLDALGLDSHGGGYHLASDLRTCGQCTE